MEKLHAQISEKKFSIISALLIKLFLKVHKIAKGGQFSCYTVYRRITWQNLMLPAWTAQ